MTSLIDKINDLEGQLEKARADLETERNIRKDIIATIPDIIYLLDINGTVLEVNDAIRQLGWSPDECIGRPLDEIVAEESRDVLMNSIMERRRRSLSNIAKEKRDPCTYEQTVKIRLRRKVGTGPVSELVEAKGKAIVLPKYYFTTRRIHASGSVSNKNHICTVGIARIITEKERLRRELLYNNTLLNALMETSPDGVLVIDPSGKPISYNNRFLELWDLTRVQMTTDEEILPYAIAQLEDPDEFIKKVEYLYAHPEETSIDEIRFKNRKIFERYSYPLINQQRKNYGRVWSFRDITARKEMERRLKDENLFLDFVIESLPGSFFMYEAGKDDLVFEYINWKLVKRNKRHMEITGVNDEEAMGNSPLFLLSKNQPEIIAAMDEILKKGSHTFEIDLENKQGTITPLLYSGNLFSHNNKTYLAGLSIDITSMKEQEYMLNAVFNSPFHLCGILDQEGRVVKVNDTALKMIRGLESEMIGRAFWKTPWWSNNKEYANRMKEHVKKCRKGKIITDYDLIQYDAEGNRRNIEFSMTPLYGFDGTVKYLVPLGRDVTEQREAMAKAGDYERQLMEQANQVELSNLTAAFIHDLNNSLQPINGYVELAMRCVEGWKSSGVVSGSLAENVVSNLKTALEASKNTYKLVDMMRQCSRGAQLEAKPIDYDITQSTDMLRGLIQLWAKKDLRHKKKIEVEVRSSGPVYASITPDHYRNIVVNLLNNAVDAIETNGNIVIEFGQDNNNRPYVSVTDNSGGIPQEYQKKIFVPRFTTKTAESGTGIGLSSSLTYANLNEANLSFESVEGKGTTFTLVMQKVKT